jgi:hypothetical protein
MFIVIMPDYQYFWGLKSIKIYNKAMYYLRILNKDKFDWQGIATSS